MTTDEINALRAQLQLTRERVQFLETQNTGLREMVAERDRMIDALQRKLKGTK